jgi:hypothetical protein
MDWAAPRGIGHPTACAEVPITMPNDALSVWSRLKKECADRPANRARTRSVRNRCRATKLAEGRHASRTLRAKTADGAMSTQSAKCRALAPASAPPMASLSRAKPRHLPRTLLARRRSFTPTGPLCHRPSDAPVEPASEFIPVRDSRYYHRWILEIEFHSNAMSSLREQAILVGDTILLRGCKLAPLLISTGEFYRHGLAGICGAGHSNLLGSRLI